MKEEDIRPEKLFNQYLSLAEQDVETYFRHAPLYNRLCPACKSQNSEFRFRKIGFDYEICLDCKTLFVNPRPVAEAFNEYYTDSPSVRFWATNFYRETESKRREHIIKPKAAMVKSIISKYMTESQNQSCILDIGAGYGIFCEELQKLLPKSVQVIAVEPATALQEVCREKGIPVIPKFLENIKDIDLPFGRKNVIAAISFELLEHLHDPDLFIENCRGVLGEGGILILTTLNWDGFDLQVLQEKSNSIHPPHHINFFTTDSVQILLKRHGFEVLEVSTPGKLDVDIASKQISDITDPFIRDILGGNDMVKSKFQTFLQESKLSSHMMVIAKLTN